LSVEPALGADASPGQAGKAPAADPALNWYGMQLTPEQAEKVFVDAFNACKGTLAGFAKCQSIGELRTVQDAFTLALGSKLCPTEYDPVKLAIVTNIQVAAKAGSAGGFEQTIRAATTSEFWPALEAAVNAKAAAVGSDLGAIWAVLEQGRVRWLTARQATHVLKTSLKQAIAEGGNVERDVLEAKMIWIYGLAFALPSCKALCDEWAGVCSITDKAQPLVGFVAEKWDPRVPAWAPLDRAVGQAAEDGGANLDEEWDALYTAFPQSAQVDDEVD